MLFRSLRDRGYAETAPVAGTFRMDADDALLLTTDYETMSRERFTFAGPDVRIRMSTVEGLSNTASFCIETRVAAPPAEGAEASPEEVSAPGGTLSLLGW